MTLSKYIYVDAQYEYTLEIIFTTDLKRSLKALYKKWDLDEEPEDCEACTVTCQYDDHNDITKYALIFNVNNLSHNIISHELLHLACFILDDRNIDLKGGNYDYENAAWLIGHLSEIVYQAISKEKYKIKPTAIKAKIKKIG